MVIVTLTYKKALTEVDLYLKEHIAFLDDYYQQKKFLASGRRENRIGGVVLVLTSSVGEAEEIMRNDPFYLHDIADYQFMLFEPSRYLDGIEALI